MSGILIGVNLFQTLEETARQQGLDFVVIGGLAVIEHGYARLTIDFDLLVQREARDRWDGLLTSLGYKLDNDNDIFRQYRKLEGVEWPIDLMFVNEKTFQGIKASAKLKRIQGALLPVASVEHLIALKLHALKHSNLRRFFKDFDDVIHLVVANNIDLHSATIRDLFLKYGDETIYAKICRACEPD